MTATAPIPATGPVIAPAKEAVLKLSPEITARLQHHLKVLKMTADEYVSLLLTENEWRLRIEEKMVAVEETIRRENFPPELADEIRRLNRRTPMEIAVSRAATAAISRPARKLPPGTTMDDLVKGLWDGNETDEELEAIIKDLKS